MANLWIFKLELTGNDTTKIEEERALLLLLALLCRREVQQARRGLPQQRRVDVERDFHAVGDSSRQCCFERPELRTPSLNCVLTNFITFDEFRHNNKCVCENLMDF